jgi:hypothetical protein
MKRCISVATTVVACCLLTTAAAGAQTRKVLTVGTYHGIKGMYSSIQAAVNAADPYDVVLVAPGDYKTTSYRIPAGSHGDFPAGLLITTPDLTIRGMNRNTVIVDGTTKGKACNDVSADQNLGPRTTGATHAGLNGIMVWKADNVNIENLTACNFLGGSGGDGGTGNEIWWNGGANSGKIGGWEYLGEYLNATSTYFPNNGTNAGLKKANVVAAEYGIFSSNWDGGTWKDTYASNQNDSGYYIGACQDFCNQTIDDGWGEYNALGYSGSNSGGSLVVEHSKFDENQDGFDTNSQNGDDPPPQNGACANGGTSPITHTHSCWVFMDNDVYDNNNPDVPEEGTAAQGPVGTGMSLSGARNDTILDNTFTDNDAWGVIVVPYLDSGKPCTGGVLNMLGTGSCLFDEWGDSLVGNTFVNDGSFGHPTNGDFAQVNFLAGKTAECYSNNTGADGAPLNAFAAALQTASSSTCPATATAPADSSSASNGQFLDEVLCDSQVQIVSGVPASCPSGAYPVTKAADVKNGLHPLPSAKKLVTMPNPCAGIPANPWCKKS